MPNSIAGQIKQATAVTVTTAATLIPTTALTGRRSTVIHNNGAVVVYLGNSSVTTADGLPISPNEKFSLDLDANVLLYGIVVTGTCELRVLEGC